MFGSLRGAVDHDLRGAELAAAVDDRQLAGELGDEDRVLHRRVAAADDDHVLTLEEGSVADAAGRDAASAELSLTGDVDRLRLRAHREDHRLRDVLVVADPDPLEAAVAELDPGRVVGDEPGPEALGLGAKAVHQLRAHDPLGEARIVFDVGRVLELPAPLEALDHERLEVRARGVDRRGVPGAGSADHDQVLDGRLAQRVLLGWRGWMPARGFTCTYNYTGRGPPARWGLPSPACPEIARAPSGRRCRAAGRRR